MSEKQSQNNAESETPDDKLATWYFPLLIVVICIALLAGWLLPYKSYVLDLGGYGKICLRVQRFSGAQEIEINRRWQPIRGLIIPSEDASKLTLELGGESDIASGRQIKIRLHNPTSWRVIQVVLGTTQTPPGGLEMTRAVRLADYAVEPFSSSDLTLAVGRGTPPPQLHLLEAVGLKSEEIR
jgi:hypothetical protein